MKTTGFSAALTVKSNGVYRAPEKVALLQTIVRRAGLRWVVVDLRRARGKHALLGACARGFQFPAGFGGNWDALADCLQDLSWLAEPGTVALLRGAADFAVAAPDEYALLLEILGASAEYWQPRGRVFIVVSEGDTGLRAFAAP
ncbi:MAG: barstar family protein [Burkholderiales bacterium]|nr:barstar family protein [Burkholderiales bacterium]